MAGITPFGYINSGTVIHRVDARFKLLFVLLFSISIIDCSVNGLALLTTALVFLACHIKMPLINTLKQLRYFSILMLFLFMAKSVSTPGNEILKLNIITITSEGVFQGAFLCWKLFTIFLAGLIFTATARTSHIKAAVQWFLAPIPLVPEKKIAIMMSLLMKFIPLVLEQVRIVTLAQKARGIENRKNPLYRLKALSIPLLRKAFESADRLALAMEARCYNEQRTDPELSVRPADFSVFLIVSFFFILVRAI